MEICPEKLDMLVERINTLYVSYRKKYVLCLPGGRLVTPKRKGELYSVLTSNVLKNHLMQKYAIAIFAGPKTSRFVCFDVDDGKKETVTGIVNALAEIGFPREHIYVSYSGGKGYHVEMFFDQLVSTIRLKDLYARMLEITGFTERQVEFRPTHGSAIKLPLSVHARTGNMCWFADRDTLELIERYDYLFEIEQIPAILLERIVPIQPVKKTSGREICRDHAMREHSYPNEIPVPDQTDDHYDIQAVGTRHNLMRKMAVHMRLTGKSRASCEKAQLQWYENQDQSLIRSSHDEVMADIQDLLDWVFSDRFKLQYDKKMDRIRITATDIKLVAGATSRSTRRVLFLLLVRSMAGRNAISISEIAAATSLNRKTAYKAISKLRDQGLLQYESGVRVMTNDGCFASERNRYKVPHYMGRRSEAYVEFQIDDVMKRFDDCYHQAIMQLMTEKDLRQCLSCDEQIEHRNHCKVKEAGDNERLDLCGKRKLFRSEVFGEIEAYTLGGRILYPLQEVARLIGWKRPEQMSNHCKVKEKWKVRTQHQIVTRNYIDQEQLSLVLRRCRSTNKQALMDWLCQ